MFYSLLIKTRVLNRRTNLGSIYLLNIYIIITSKVKVNKTSFIKKNGTNCGIVVF